MTEDEATRIAGHLIARTQGWDEPSITAWINDLMALANPHAALTAVKLTVETPGLIGRPHWGDYRQRYLTELRRLDMQRPALPAGPRPSHARDGWRRRDHHPGLPSYLEQLAMNATTNPDDATELDTWRRLAHTNAPDLIPHDWHRTLATLTRTEDTP